MSIFTNKFDSIKNDWITPDILFDKLNTEFQFTWDLAADSENAKCSNFFNEGDNGLIQKWDGICWLNPPYGIKSSKMSDWVKKAYLETQENTKLTVVMLIPARTNTKWFHQFCMKSAEIRFICGRPKFKGNKHGLPQPLLLVVFRNTTEKTVISSYYL